MEKLQWLGFPSVEKNEDMITRLDSMYEHVRQTDTRTPHNGKGRAAKTHQYNVSVQCTMSKKLDPFSFEHNFRKYRPIFIARQDTDTRY